jgi:hypothetical protein
LFVREFKEPNIDIKNAHKIPRIATIVGGNQIDFSWSDDKKLIIKYGSLELREYFPKWNEVKIIYQK